MLPLSSLMVLRLALTTPNCILNAQCVAPHAHSPFGGVANHKPALLDVLFADRSATELANCPRFLFTLDAFHLRAPMPTIIVQLTTCSDIETCASNMQCV